MAKLRKNITSKRRKDQTKEHNKKVSKINISIMFRTPDRTDREEQVEDRGEGAVGGVCLPDDPPPSYNESQQEEMGSWSSYTVNSKVRV